MSFFQFLFPIATVILSALCYVCYKTNKPLRERARKEAEAIALKELQDAKWEAEKAAREDLRKKVFSDLEQAIATPDILLDQRYGSQTRGNGYRWKHLSELIFSIKQMKDQSETIRDLLVRTNKQSELIRVLQKGQKDIMKALQMGNPVEL